MKGYIHSLQSLGTVDGPGVRAVVFAAGCPLRCAYCHNPDTWVMSDGEPTEARELAGKIARLYNYIKDGGVTLSGGEPLLQAEFFTELTELLHERGLHVALDTSGAVTGDAALRLISSVDLLMLDVKFTTDDDYKHYTGGTLHGTLGVLDYAERIGKPTLVRHVIVPGINDTDEDAARLGRLLSRYTVITDVEMLPFKKLCIEKYKALGIPFPLIDTPAGTDEVARRLHLICKRNMKESV